MYLAIAHLRNDFFVFEIISAIDTLKDITSSYLSGNNLNT